MLADLRERTGLQVTDCEVKRIDFGRMEEAFPAFIIIVMIALSYSISTGLAFGFVSYVVIKILSGKLDDVKGAMWVIALLSVLFLVIDELPALIDHLQPWLGGGATVDPDVVW